MKGLWIVLGELIASLVLVFLVSSSDSYFFSAQENITASHDVRKIDDILIHLQREKNVGDKINLGILRGGQPMNITVNLEQRPNL